MAWRTRVCLVALVGGLSGCTKAKDLVAPQATSNPPANPRAAPPGSADRAVLNLLRFVQLDTPVLAVDFYHPNVIRALGATTIVNALSTQSAPLLSGKIGRLRDESTRRGKLVTFAFRRPNNQVTTYAFLLRNVEGRWRIIYDSLLQGALLYAPGASAEVIARRKEAMRRYRGLFTTGPPLPLGQ